MVVVPLAFFIMLLALVLIFVPLPALQGAVAWLLQMIVDSMNYLLRLIASLPGVSLELPWIDVPGALCVAVIVALSVYSLLRRKLWAAIATGVVSLLFAASILLSDALRSNERYILFFNNRDCPVVQFVVSRKQSYVLSSRSSLDAELDNSCRPYWKRENMDTPLWVNDSYGDDVLTFTDGMAEFSRRRIMLLADDCWRDEENMRPVDCLYLCRGFLGSIEELFTVYPASFVVMDASLYANSRRRIAGECAELGIRCIDISREGAMRWDCSAPELTIYPAR